MSYKIKEIFKLYKEGSIVIPDFQRDYVWTFEQQKKLIATALVKLPLGSILTINGSKGSFGARQIGLKSKSGDHLSSKVEYILDGQQRITTLITAFNDFYNEKGNWIDYHKNMYSKLNRRIFFDLSEEASVDIFGYSNLQFRGLETHDASEIIENLKSCEVYRTENKDKALYQPYQFYKRQESTGDETKIYVDYIKELALNKMIPLYQILDETDNWLTSSVISKIAINKSFDLKKECEKNPKKLAVIFKNDFDFLEKYSNNTHTSDDISQSFNKLSSDWASNVQLYLKNIAETTINRINMDESEIGRAISVFENVNMTGTKLNNFDLLVARYAKGGYKQTLYERIEDQMAQIISQSQSNGLSTFDPECFGIKNSDNFSKNFKNHFMSLLSLNNKAKHIKLSELSVEALKAKAILSMTPDEIQCEIDSTIVSLLRSYAFLQSRCGIVNIEDIHYKLIVIPLAFTLKSNDVWNSVKYLDFVEYYYWTAIFSGEFRYRQNEQCITDLLLINDFMCSDGKNRKIIDRGSKCFSIEEFSDLKTLLYKSDREPNSSISTFIFQYILSKEPIDFISGEIITAKDIAECKSFVYKDGKEVMEIEKHHIIPLANMTTIGESTKKIRGKKEMINSPLNITCITRFSNRIISDYSYEKYSAEMGSYTNHSQFLPSIKEDTIENIELFLTDRFNLIKSDLENHLFKLLKKHN